MSSTELTQPKRKRPNTAFLSKWIVTDQSLKSLRRVSNPQSTFWLALYHMEKPRHLYIFDTSGVTTEEEMKLKAFIQSRGMDSCPVRTPFSNVALTEDGWSCGHLISEKALSRQRIEGDGSTLMSAIEAVWEKADSAQDAAIPEVEGADTSVTELTWAEKVRDWMGHDVDLTATLDPRLRTTIVFRFQAAPLSEAQEGKTALEMLSVPVSLDIDESSADSSPVGSAGPYASPLTTSSERSAILRRMTTLSSCDCQTCDPPE